jgi:methyltransferase (TIGR00027 family)
MKLNFMFVIQRMLELSGRLTLPNLSSMLLIGKLRYIQSVYEEPEYRNPDTLIRDFLPPVLRWLCMLQAKMRQSKLRLDPFYYYLLARTKYYDQVFIDAICSNTKLIINIGCGSDTRAYRFSELLRHKGIHVLECDQRQSIFVKEQLAKRRWCTDHITYVAIDLNADTWPELEHWITNVHSTVLVILEGVSPYVDEKSFNRFLRFMAEKLHVGSRLVYDFKIASAEDDFGKDVLNHTPFRLPATKRNIIAYHKTLGYELEQMELSSELSSRLLPSLSGSGARLFAKDCLLQLTVAKIRSCGYNSSLAASPTGAS